MLSTTEHLTIKWFDEAVVVKKKDDAVRREELWRIFLERRQRKIRVVRKLDNCTHFTHDYCMKTDKSKVFKKFGLIVSCILV